MTYANRNHSPDNTPHDDHLEHTINAIARALDSAQYVAIVTGAGVSAESNIPTFRDSMEGLWAKFDPQTLATPEAFNDNPQLVTRWYDHRRIGCLAAKPNPGHLALAKLEHILTKRNATFVLLTQNVDGLHRRAGNQNVVELHGSLNRWRCTHTNQELEPHPQPFETFPPPSPFAEGAILRPAVVWFGEMLPEHAIEAATHAANHADVFLSIGTSALVYPAAGFISAAASNGATTIEINQDDTPISQDVTHSIRARSGVLLPRIIERMQTTPNG